MAQQGIQMDQEILCCSICLDLLKDPVTISCGHSYCMSCIKSHWDEEDQKRIYSCPQCRQAFRPRPVLVRNTMLADLVEELKKTGLQAAPADHCCYAEPGDVACDVCTGRKLKATKSCLQCLVSYCEQHLQPHYESTAFDKHKLVEPSKKLQENICSRHKEVMKVFCRSDQQSICYLCSMDEHKGHDTVPAAAERFEKQRELGESRQRIQKRIQDMERDVKVLQQEVKAVDNSADKAVRDSEKIFTKLVRLIEKKSSDVRKQITSQQETEVSRIKDLQDKLQQEITELKRKDIELDQLSLTEDHAHFLHSYPSLSQLSTNLSIIDIRPLQYFEDVSAAVSDATDKLEDTLNDEWTKISLTVTNVDVLLPQAEPKTRDKFLKYSWKIKLDPNTAHKLMILSDGNGKATVNELSIPAVVKFAVTFAVKSLLEEPTRFDMRIQVLSQESLPGRCYWEVETEGEVFVAVAYEDISRTEVESEFGHNDKSWSLQCANNSYEFRHDKRETSISGPQSSRVGVYLDHRAGILSFYSVSETMTLLHRVHTTFTQPLYAGLRLDYKSTAQLY